jgi:Ribosomal protein L5
MAKEIFPLGIKEQIIFPEIDYDNIDTLRGMDITLVTSAKDDNEGYKLLKMFNMPINN